MKKRITGMRYDDETNSVVPIERDEYDCICICDRDFEEPRAFGGGGLVGQPSPTYPEKYIKGEKYQFCIDEEDTITLGHRYQVFIDNNVNFMTKEEFDKYFKEITEYREDKINDILNL